MNESKSKGTSAEDDCFVCIGLSFLSAEISSGKNKPTCFGLEYKTVDKIGEDAMKRLDDAPTLSPGTALFQLGFSQSSEKMHHTGRVPVLKYGVSLTVRSQESAAAQTQNQSASQDCEPSPHSTPAQIGHTDNKASSRLAPTVTTSSQSAVGNLTKFFSILGTVGGNFSNSATGIFFRLPAHLPRASHRASDAVSRRLEFEWRRLKTHILHQD